MWRKTVALIGNMDHYFYSDNCLQSKDKALQKSSTDLVQFISAKEG